MPRLDRFPYAFAALAGLALTLAACGDKDAKKGASPDLSAPSGTGGSSQPNKVDATATTTVRAGAGGYGYAAALGDELDKQTGEALHKGRTYLLGKRDDATGGWDPTGPVAAGYTAFGALALIATTPKESVSTDPTILKALEFLKSKQKDDGSIWSNAQYVNYETSVALAALAGARVAAMSGVQGKARDFIAASQIHADETALSYGGFPYQSKSDPTAPADLSNAQFAAAGLHEAGLPADNEVWKRLAAYLAKVQNRAETNTTVVKRADKDLKTEVEIVSGNDGGAGYGPGMSKSGLIKRADGKYEVRSYGSMTYALVKCLLFAGVKADDPRVAAAIAWASKNFALDRNPGFEHDADAAKKGQQGYYYYLLTMARALAEYEKATGKAMTVTDAEGKPHAWRREIAARLVSLQKADGSWQNPVDRWEEGNPLVVSSYAMQALAICQGRLP